MVLIIVLVVTRFRHEIGGILRRVGRVSFGGAQVELSQPEDAPARPQPLEAVVGKGRAEDSTAAEAKPPSVADALYAGPERTRLVNWIQQNPEEALEYVSQLSLEVWNERTYRFIFGSQLRLVDHLASLGERGDAYVNLSRFYGEFLSRHSGVEWDMNRYLRYLQTSGLIEVFNADGSDGSLRVRVTPTGANFMSYVKSVHALDWQGKPN